MSEKIIYDVRDLRDGDVAEFRFYDGGYLIAPVYRDRWGDVGVHLNVGGRAWASFVVWFSKSDSDEPMPEFVRATRTVHPLPTKKGSLIRASGMVDGERFEDEDLVLLNSATKWYFLDRPGLVDPNYDALDSIDEWVELTTVEKGADD